MKLFDRNGSDEKKKITRGDYFNLALCAFAGLGAELVLVRLIEEPLLGYSIKEYTTFQSIAHWILICTIWGIVGKILLRSAKNKYEFDIWETKSTLKIWQYIAVLICLAVALVVSRRDWNGFKPVLEFQRLGMLKFIFQYIYYMFESFLFSLIIIFGQLACEKWFKRTNFPFGGIILGLTWGLGHILSKGSVAVGLLSVFSAFLFGSVYLVVGKDYRKALPLMFLMFVI